MCTCSVNPACFQEGIFEVVWFHHATVFVKYSVCVPHPVRRFTGTLLRSSTVLLQVLPVVPVVFVPDSTSVTRPLCFSWSWHFWRVQVTYFVKWQQFGSVWRFLMFRFNCVCLAGAPQKWGCVVLRVTAGICPVTADGNFDDLVKVLLG